jgi:hypothetical protein
LPETDDLRAFFRAKARAALNGWRPSAAQIAATYAIVRGYAHESSGQNLEGIAEVEPMVPTLADPTNVDATDELAS